MSYGFIFPKQGKTINSDVKDLAWRDDQKIFLAQDRVTKTQTFSSGTNLNNQSISITLPLTYDWHVYKAFLTDASKTIQCDSTNYTTIGGRNFIISSYMYPEMDYSGDPTGTATIGVRFLANGSGSITSAQTLTLSAYICLQSI